MLFIFSYPKDLNVLICDDCFRLTYYLSAGLPNPIRLKGLEPYNRTQSEGIEPSTNKYTYLTACNYTTQKTQNKLGKRIRECCFKKIAMLVYLVSLQVAPVGIGALASISPFIC